MSKALRRPNGTFAPGWRGGGRPAGSRNRLSEIALGMLAENFEEHGEETIEEVRKSLPHIYLKIIAGLLLRSLHVERTSVLGELSDEELQLLEEHLAAVRARTVRELEINGAAIALEPEAKQQEK